jgi:hypothetical protein
MNKPLPFVSAQGVGKAIVVALRKLCDVVYIAETMASAKDDAVLHEANLPDRPNFNNPRQRFRRGRLRDRKLTPELFCARCKV